MDFTGTIIHITPTQSGVSKTSGKPWASLQFVVKTADEYPKSACFRVFGQEKIDSFKLAVGQTVNVSFDINANEYNGKWYNDLNAWKVDLVMEYPAIQQVSNAQTQNQQAGQGVQPNTSSDLPF